MGRMTCLDIYQRAYALYEKRKWGRDEMRIIVRLLNAGDLDQAHRLLIECESGWPEFCRDISIAADLDDMASYVRGLKRQPRPEEM